MRALHVLHGDQCSCPAMLLRKNDYSGLDQNVMMAAVEVVEAVQQECKELERKGWKRKSSERHRYERRQLGTPPSGSEVSGLFCVQGCYP